MTHPEHIAKKPAKVFISMMKTFLIFIMVCAPVAVSLLGIMLGISNYQYPVYDPIMIGLMILLFFSPMGVLCCIIRNCD